MLVLNRFLVSSFVEAFWLWKTKNKINAIGIWLYPGVKLLFHKISLNSQGILTCEQRLTLSLTILSDWSLTNMSQQDLNEIRSISFSSNGSKNETKLYADDTKLLAKVVNSKTEMHAVLDKITAWCNKWQMYLNSSKCKIMHIGKKNPQLTYTIANPDGSIPMLESTTCEKDLVITITSNPNWSTHVKNVVS